MNWGCGGFSPWSLHHRGERENGEVMTEATIKVRINGERIITR